MIPEKAGVSWKHNIIWRALALDVRDLSPNYGFVNTEIRSFETSAFQTLLKICGEGSAVHGPRSFRSQECVPKEEHSTFLVILYFISILAKERKRSWQVSDTLVLMESCQMPHASCVTSAFMPQWGIIWAQTYTRNSEVYSPLLSFYQLLCMQAERLLKHQQPLKLHLVSKSFQLNYSSLKYNICNCIFFSLDMLKEFYTLEGAGPDVWFRWAKPVIVAGHPHSLPSPFLPPYLLSFPICTSSTSSFLFSLLLFTKSTMRIMIPILCDPRVKIKLNIAHRIWNGGRT